MNELLYPDTKQHIRFVGTKDRPEWVAQDVADVLGISKVRNTLSKFRDSEKGAHTVGTLGGTQKMLTVTEPGLYRLIFLSRKPEAERFQSWIFHDVLPCIRRYGCYPAPANAVNMELLEQFVAPELRPWVKTFPDAFYIQMFRLLGWHHKDPLGKRPILIGKLTNDLVYDRIVPGMREELARVNPSNKNNERPAKHHQYLTESIGHPVLKAHLAQVIALMKVSATWEGFLNKLDMVCPKVGNSYEMVLSDTPVSIHDCVVETAGIAVGHKR